MYTLYSMDHIGLPNYSINKAGQVYSHHYEKFLVITPDYKGYDVVNLVLPDRRKVPQKIHRLLALMFIPNPENKEQVNHINGVRNDNSLSNLEWATHRENSTHAVETGLYPQGKINTNMAHLICSRLEKGMDVRSISRELDIPYGAISSIQLRKSWEHVSCQYNLPPIKFMGRALTDDETTMAQRLLNKRFTQSDIAKFLGVSESRVNMIRHEMLYGKK